MYCNDTFCNCDIDGVRDIYLSHRYQQKCSVGMQTMSAPAAPVIESMRRSEAERVFHHNKCLYSKASKMLDPHECAAYSFAQLTSTNPQAETTYGDVYEQCQRDIARVTPRELHELCWNIADGYRESEIIKRWGN